MYSIMMEQIANDRIGDARKQAQAHRKARQAKVAQAAGLDLFRRISGGVSSLRVSASKRLSPGRVLTQGSARR